MGGRLAHHSTRDEVVRLPGCTADQSDNQTWTLTSTQLATYNHMRGSCVDTPNTLGSWLGTQAREGQGLFLFYEGEAVDFDHAQLQNFDKEVCEAHQEFPQIIHECRQGVVEVPRPEYNHISPPVLFDLPAAVQKVM